MPKSKGDICIGFRAYEEACRIFGNGSTGSLKLGLSRKAAYAWSCGICPNALAFARLHYAGADVIYILTGKRER